MEIREKKEEKRRCTCSTQFRSLLLNKLNICIGLTEGRPLFIDYHSNKALKNPRTHCSISVNDQLKSCSSVGFHQNSPPFLSETEVVENKGRQAVFKNNSVFFQTKKYKNFTQGRYQVSEYWNNWKLWSSCINYYL